VRRASGAHDDGADGTAEDGAGTGPVVAFYGDSYTLGTGATDASRRWSSIVSATRGWTEVNPSVNGLGFVRNRSVFGAGDVVDAVIGAGPDLVIVTLGLNDNFAFEAAGTRIAEQIVDDLSRLRTALPEARMVVVEPFWYTDERPRSVEAIIGWVREAAAGIGADHIAGASRFLEGRPEWIGQDGLHPNDDGYAEIAARMDSALRAIGL
jgi:lysophospholipase L1-like esterase